MAYRTYCEVLHEIRECFKTYNFSPILSLCEELQIIGNRMEAGLGEKKSLELYRDRVHEAKKEYREILDEVNKLRMEAGKNLLKKEDRFW